MSGRGTEGTWTTRPAIHGPTPARVHTASKGALLDRRLLDKRREMKQSTRGCRQRREVKKPHKILEDANIICQQRRNTRWLPHCHCVGLVHGTGKYVPVVLLRLNARARRREETERGKRRERRGGFSSACLASSVPVCLVALALSTSGLRLATAHKSLHALRSGKRGTCAPSYSHASLRCCISPFLLSFAPLSLLLPSRRTSPTSTGVVRIMSRDRNRLLSKGWQPNCRARRAMYTTASAETSSALGGMMRRGGRGKRDGRVLDCTCSAGWQPSGR